MNTIEMERTPERTCYREPLSVDDWLQAHGNHRAEFQIATFGHGCVLPPGTIKCTLTCNHKGNYVSGEGFAKHSGDAFLEAVTQIEKTIGD